MPGKYHSKSGHHLSQVHVSFYSPTAISTHSSFSFSLFQTILDTKQIKLNTKINYFSLKARFFSPVVHSQIYTRVCVYTVT